MNKIIKKNKRKMSRVFKLSHHTDNPDIRSFYKYGIVWHVTSNVYSLLN